MKRSIWLLVMLCSLVPVAPQATWIVGVQFASANDSLNQNLIKASLSGNLEEVKTLIEQGANVNATNLQGVTPLMVAALGGHAAVTRHLIAKISKSAADVNVQDANGMTALMAASRQGHAEVVKLLLDAGANKKLKAKNGLTAEDYASAGNHSNIIELLSKSK